MNLVKISYPHIFPILFFHSSYSYLYASNLCSLEIEANSEITLDKNLEGDGGLNKDGSGTLIISGSANTYLGGTCISKGTLIVNSSIGSHGGNTTILPNAILKGTGTIGRSSPSTTVINSGNIVVGSEDINSVSSNLKINGDYVQEPEGNLIVRADPTNNRSDTLAVTGTTQLDGTLYFIPFIGDYSKQKSFLIIRTPKLSGVFNKVTRINNSDSYQDHLSSNVRYQENNVYLDLQETSNPIDTNKPTILNNETLDYSLNDKNEITFDQSLEIQNTSSIKASNSQKLTINNTINIADNSNFKLESGKFLVNNTVNLNSSTSSLEFNNTEVTLQASNSTNKPLLSGSGRMNVINTSTAINNSIINLPVYVDSTSKLKGNGSFQQPVNSEGILQPGNSVGLLTFENDYTMATSHKFVVEVSDSPVVVNNVALKASKAIVNGKANLNGDVIVILNAGTYAVGQEEYTLLEAGTLAGYLNNLKWVPVDGMSFSVSYTQDKKQVILKRTTSTTTVIPALQESQHATLSLSIPQTTPVDSGDSSPGSDSSSAVTNIIGAIGAVSTKEAQNTAQKADSFRSYSYLRRVSKTPSKEKFETLLNAVAENGPMVFEKQGYRVWVSPYGSRSKTNPVSTAAGTRGWNLGTLFGFEYNSKKTNICFGAFTGISLGKTHIKSVPDTFTKSKSVTFGIYHAREFKNGARYDILLGRTKSFLQNQRFINISETAKYYAQSNTTQTTYFGDVLGSFKVDLPYVSSLRFSVGNTFIHNQISGYIEKGADKYSRTQSESTTKSAEIYLGIGLRKVWIIGPQTAVKITGLYEYGQEYYRKGEGGKIIMNNSIILPGPTQRSKTHYFTLNTSIGDRENGFKIIGSYSGAYTKYSKNHMFIIKGEYRF